ncbi:hypothetical protein D3C80_1905800 [compost metagenome]
MESLECISEDHFSLTDQSMVDTLEVLSQTRPLPQTIGIENGTGFTSKSCDEWAR